MRRTASTRDEARTALRAAQAGAVVLLFGAAAVAAMGVPGLGDGVTEAPTPEDVQVRAEEIRQERVAAAASRQPELVRADLGTAAKNLALTMNAPRPSARPEEQEEGPQAEGGSTEPQPPRPPVAAPPEVRYLGTIRERDRLLALVAIGTTQRILGAGMSATVVPAPPAEAAANGAGRPGGEEAAPERPPVTVRVVSVTPDKLEVEVDGEPVELAASARSGGLAMTMAAAAALPPAATAEAGGRGEGAVVDARGRRDEDGRGGFGNMSREDREAFRERMQNMSPEERREAFRQMREQRGDRGRGDDDDDDDRRRGDD